MKRQARVVIIGGGIAGCSALYHLTKMGWCDVMLIERDELTSGSTWHAAAQVTQFGGNQTFVALKRYSINLYRKLSADKHFPIDYHITSGMRLAHTETEMDIYRHYVGMARGVGIDFELIDGKEVTRRHRLLAGEDLLGAWWDPLDGDIDPSQLTQALARKARQNGAEILRFTPVIGLTQKRDSEWIVHTTKGDVQAEIVVNAAGYRVNEVGAMMGITHPVVSMEHMYFLTESICELEAQEKRVPIVRCPKDGFYSRQEKKGLLVGVYEQRCKPFGMNGIDPNFTMSLCENDLDRCLESMEGIFSRIPALTKTGIHTVINGPITYSADGMPLVGPIPQVRNAFCIVGLRAGIGEGGGHGKLLAEWIVEGQTEWESWFLNPCRFGSHANTEFTLRKAIEDYQREFDYHLPLEERPAGRLAKTTSLYPVLKEHGAEFGTVNGWERALYFKPNASFIHRYGYRSTSVHRRVAKEVQQVHHHVGVMEVSGFGRFEIRGSGAKKFLDYLTCSRLPHRSGKIRLCYLLNHKGSVLSEATITKLASKRYWYGCATNAELHDLDWLQQHLPNDGSVVIENLTSSYSMLVLAGPKSRKLLRTLCPRDDVSVSRMPWLTTQTLTIGYARVQVLAVSFSGELAFELHVPTESLYLVWQTLMDAGEAFQLRPFGSLAAESMRLEKGYRHWKADISVEFSPFEAGLDPWVDHQKSDYMGKNALNKRDIIWQFIQLQVDAKHAHAHNGDPIFAGHSQIGTVTSGGYGFRTDRNIAFGYVRRNKMRERYLGVGILGKHHSATLLRQTSFDPQNARMKC